MAAMVPHVEKLGIHSWRISRLRLLIGEGALGYNHGKFRTTGEQCCSGRHQLLKKSA